MKKESILLFLLSVAMALTFISCRTHSLKTDLRNDLKLKVDSTGTLVSSQTAHVLASDTKATRVDSAAQQLHANKYHEQEETIYYVPYIAPSGEVTVIPQRKTTKSKERITTDLLTVQNSKVNFWQSYCDSLQKSYDSLHTDLKLDKSQKSTDKKIEKTELPDYVIWLLICVSVLAFMWWVWRTK